MEHRYFVEPCSRGKHTGQKDLKQEGRNMEKTVGEAGKVDSWWLFLSVLPRSHVWLSGLSQSSVSSHTIYQSALVQWLFSFPLHSHYWPQRVRPHHLSADVNGHQTSSLPSCLPYEPCGPLPGQLSRIPLSSCRRALAIRTAYQCFSLSVYCHMIGTSSAQRIGSRSDGYCFWAWALHC